MQARRSLPGSSPGTPTRRSLRRAIPSLFTLASLVAAFGAIVLAMEGAIGLAGGLILVAYLLDAVDGALARRMQVVSDFGRQLDSLVDLVSFGIAPAILLYRHLSDVGAWPAMAWSACALFVCTGAFRLARFNLMPAKTTFGESLGLTISTSGATLTLITLVNDAYANSLIHATMLILLCLGLATLMASRIRYPALATVLQRRHMSIALLSLAALMALRLSPPVAGLSLTGGYVSFGLIRALVQRG
jgi:CDP-diacylglycerol---serine O-phosphatidyltransferase